MADYQDRLGTARQHTADPYAGQEWLGGENYGNLGRPGSSRSRYRQRGYEPALGVARGLGWFSIGLGMAELVAPHWLGRQTGLGQRTTLLRVMGLREIASGLAVLARPRSPWPLWGRFAGDLLDLAVLINGYRSSSQRERVAVSIAMVAGVTLLDAMTARQLKD